MKKLYFLFSLFLSILSFAQTQDLYTLAKGDFIGFNALFDDKDNLYGYVSVYSYGKSGDKTKKFEYVILDKNLNPVANKEFEGDITAGNYFGYIDFNKKMILAPLTADYSLIKGKDYFTPRSVEVDLATNTPKTKIYYDYQSGKFNEIAQPKNWKEEKKENKAEKRDKGYNYESYVYEIKQGGYLVLEFNDYGNYVNNNSLIRFDENNKEIWKYRYNTNGDKKANEILKVIDKDERYIYALMKKTDKREKDFSLIIIDIKTGEETMKKPLLGLNDTTLEHILNFYDYTDGEIDNDKTFDDKIVIVGRHLDSFYRMDGFARLIIDKENLDYDVSILNYIPHFYELKNISNYGGVESGYQLKTKDFFFMQDGSVGILMEKYKPEGQYNAPKTTDMVYAFTDKDFLVKGIKVFEKEKTKWANNDYLFSQYLNDGKDVVFFFRDLQKDDKTKEKNWKLFINTLIDGNFKQEEVQISEKDSYTVSPYVGKEGYILLREFNEKEKFNKIRLERLNY